MGVFPPQSVSAWDQELIVAAMERVVLALGARGLVNAQFIVRDDGVYLIEVNPRASRTVPFLSKVTCVPMVDLAVRIALGSTLREQGWGGGLLPPPGFVAVKAPAFSTSKLRGVDPSVGPGMQATGEVIGIHVDPRVAMAKALLAKEVLAKVEALRPRLLPADVQLETTRNYGQTAEEKSNELVEHLLIATLSGAVLIALAMGWRAGSVVLIAVPVTLALTLFIYFVAGYTLNRVTLFALIFSIGILVYDAIVVVENIERHFREKPGQPFLRTAVEAVDEVGNPTILATFTVIASLLPLAFVGGLMGPYMRPIPINASWAMLQRAGRPGCLLQRLHHHGHQLAAHHAGSHLPALPRA